MDKVGKCAAGPHQKGAGNGIFIFGGGNSDNARQTAII